ncbi:hypothetical protein BKE30_15125 [Alkanindiges hydrocarboniclasticus]|uniref:Uncharacterized protein n=1 Tax=Alkanindiges hydrocarboniclasticus TaxID=1907941 RepID=A0A1S8CS05_9GAMM|nr:hypothetical protein [Alkanindiges hydrocarboniclasticus]ONG37167.1 hypothetical protein BKE30_15125 [Alkanindiges hydrocarboniclasticus]
MKCYLAMLPLLLLSSFSTNAAIIVIQKNSASTPITIHLPQKPFKSSISQPSSSGSTELLLSVDDVLDNFLSRLNATFYADPKMLNSTVTEIVQNYKNNGFNFRVSCTKNNDALILKTNDKRIFYIYPTELGGIKQVQ